jgi:hypothetical protein
LKIKQPLALPTKKSTPASELSAYSILLYGQEKIGKTSFASQFPKPIFLLFEPGGKSLEIYKEDVKDWTHFRRLLTAIENDKFFENVIFDTADVAYTMADRWVCEANGISDLEDLGHGKGWRKVRIEFHSCVNRLLKSGKGVLFTSHATEKSFKTRDGDEVDRTVPTMSKQARDILEPIVDIWAYYRYAGKGREFVVRGNEEISAGTRTKGHFLGIDRIPAGNSEEEAYANFVAAFNNQLGAPAKKTGFNWKLKK